MAERSGAIGEDGPVDERRRLGEELARLALGLVLLVALRLSPTTLREFVVGLRFAFELARVQGITNARLPDGTQRAIDVGRVAWPLLLALAARRSRSPALGKALTLTCAILAAETFFTVILGRGFGVVFGESADTYELPPSLASRAFAVAFGTARLGLEAWLTVRSARLAARAYRLARREGERPGSPRAVAGRLAVLGAFLFAGLVATGPIWDGYIQLLSADSGLRRLVLRHSPPARRGRPVRTSPVVRRSNRADRLYGEAADLDRSGKHAAALKSYEQALLVDEALAKDFPSQDALAVRLALGRNNVAWFLATCPDASLRDPKRAVELARGAVGLLPAEGNYWNTLGAAFLRAGRLDEAERTFGRSMSLRRGGDAFDWFLLSLVLAEQGREPEARQRYDQAAAWTDRHIPGSEELHRFRAEAASRLGLPRPDPLPDPTRPAARGRIRSQSPLPQPVVSEDLDGPG